MTDTADIDQQTPEARHPATGGPSFTAPPLWRVRLSLARKVLGRNWRLFARNKIGLVGLGIIVIFALMALAHPLLMGRVWDPVIYDPVQGYDSVFTDYVIVDVVQDPSREIELFDAQLLTHPFVKVGETISVPLQPAPPSRSHWLGTDPVGRDVLSQLMYSTRAAFALGAIAALVTVFVATTIGAVAAYYGRWIDGFLMRLAKRSFQELVTQVMRRLRPPAGERVLQALHRHRRPRLRHQAVRWRALSTSRTPGCGTTSPSCSRAASEPGSNVVRDSSPSTSVTVPQHSSSISA